MICEECKFELISGNGFYVCPNCGLESDSKIFGTPAEFAVEYTALPNFTNPRLSLLSKQVHSQYEKTKIRRIEEFKRLCTLYRIEFKDINEMSAKFETFRRKYEHELLIKTFGRFLISIQNFHAFEQLNRLMREEKNDKLHLILSLNSTESNNPSINKFRRLAEMNVPADCRNIVYKYIDKIKSITSVHTKALLIMVAWYRAKNVSRDEVLSDLAEKLGYSKFHLQSLPVSYKKQYKILKNKFSEIVERNRVKQTDSERKFKSLCKKFTVEQLQQIAKTENIEELKLLIPAWNAFSDTTLRAYQSIIRSQLKKGGKRKW